MSVAPTERPAVSMEPPYPAALNISGPSWRSSLASNGMVPLVRPEMHLGRLAGNEIVLSDPGASRNHAVVRWTPEGYVIQDLGSSNGTMVEGRRISEPVVLVPGQHIRIGETEILFQALQVVTGGADAPGPAAPDASPAPAARAAPEAAAASPTIHIAAPGAGTATLATMSSVALARAARRSEAAAIERWLRAQIPKLYWRVFAVLLVGYAIAASLLSSTLNTHALPLVALLGGALVPVTFVVYCWEQGAFADLPVTVVALAFASGATVGLILAAYLEQALISGGSFTFGTALVVALCEETAKVAALFWFMRDRRLRSEFDGLVLGAAAGMGFAALETAGYGIDNFLQGAFGYLAASGSQSVTLHDIYAQGVQQMLDVLRERIELAVFGHGVWTAIIAAAIWRERGSEAIRITSGVLLAYGISVLLHALWDTPLSFDVEIAGFITLKFLVLGVAGLLVLRFFIQESVQRAKLGPDAPPPPPLWPALRQYFVDLFNRVPRPAINLSAFTAPGPIPGGRTVPGATPPAPAGTATAAQPGPAAAPPSGTVNCPACGAQSPATSSFCGSCGSPLRQRAQSERDSGS